MIIPFKPITERGLTDREKDIALSVFGNSLNVSNIKLCTHWLVLKGYAISPNGHIYFHKNELPKDFSAESLSMRSWFVHELTHVWQIQQGLNVFRHALFDRRYQYIIKKGKDFLKYGIEQQAQMVQDYYEKRELGIDGSEYIHCIPFLKHHQSTDNQFCS